jgi:hypothetical protein
MLNQATKGGLHSCCLYHLGFHGDLDSLGPPSLGPVTEILAWSPTAGAPRLFSFIFQNPDYCFSSETAMIVLLRTTFNIALEKVFIK